MPVRCPRLLPAGTAMTDAHESSASAAAAMPSEEAARPEHKRLEDELEVVNHRKGVAVKDGVIKR